MNAYGDFLMFYWLLSFLKRTANVRQVNVPYEIKVAPSLPFIHGLSTLVDPISPNLSLFSRSLGEINYIIISEACN